MTQAAGEVLQGFSRGFFSYHPPQTTPSSSPAPVHFLLRAPPSAAGRALVLYSTGSFRVSVTSIRSPSRQISMVT